VLFIGLVVYSSPARSGCLPVSAERRSPTTSDYYPTRRPRRERHCRRCHARHSARGALRTGWIWLAVALALYFVGVAIGNISWLRGPIRSRVPLTFSSAHFIRAGGAALFLIRAAAVRVPWIQLSLDATIFCRWFRRVLLVPGDPPRGSARRSRPAQASPESGVPRLDCVLLLALGVLVLTGAGNVGGRRIPLLLLSGFATMFLATSSGRSPRCVATTCRAFFRRAVPDLLRAVAPPGAHRCVQLWCRRVQCRTPRRSGAFAPYAASSQRFWYWCTSPAAHRRADDRDDHDRVCTHAAFMVRQGVVLRGDALLRERARLAWSRNDTRR